MQPGFLKLVTIIIQKCKYEIPTDAANSVINKDDENAYNAPFTRTKIGEFGCQYREYAPPARNRNGWFRKRASGQVQAKSPEWIRRGVGGS